MAAYFEAGEISNDLIRTPRINYSGVLALYEKEMLSTEVQEQIATYNSRLAGFELIETVTTPKGLQTTLRHYQQKGLNWLNFLDDFGFGGCLADDMGLGKTFQAITFLQCLKDKYKGSTNLVVCLASLI